MSADTPRTADSVALPVEATPLPGYPELRCAGLDEGLAEALIARTLDARDVRLREMTHDLARFSSMGRLDQWRPGRDLICLQDAEESLLGVFWIAEKPLPKRDDYLDPEPLHAHDLSITCAIRTYGAARGKGRLTKAFAEHALEELLRRRGGRPSVWYQTKAANSAARALGRQLGFFEASGEAGGTVIGVRLGDEASG